MLTTEIRNKFIQAIKQGTAELEKQQNETYQIQEVLNEFNRVLGLIIIVDKGLLKAGNVTLCDFMPTNRGFPITANFNSVVTHIANDGQLVDYLCSLLKTPAILKLIKDEQNEKF